jgi:hypothetical protein
MAVVKKRIEEEEQHMSPRFSPLPSALAVLVLWVAGLGLMASTFIAPETPLAAQQSDPTPSRIIFLHGASGTALIEEGDLRPAFAARDYVLWDHGPNTTGLVEPDGTPTGTNWSVPDPPTTPEALVDIFEADPALNPESVLAHLLDYDIIMIRASLPALIDENVVNNYQRAFLQIRNTMDNYPDKLFVILSPLPLAPGNVAGVSDLENRQLVSDFLSSEEFLAGHPNVYTFDIFSLLQDDEGYLRADYVRDPFDSTPNAKANRDIGPLLVEAVDGYLADYRLFLARTFTETAAGQVMMGLDSLATLLRDHNEQVDSYLARIVASHQAELAALRIELNAQALAAADQEAVEEELADEATDEATDETTTPDSASPDEAEPAGSPPTEAVDPGGPPSVTGSEEDSPAPVASGQGDILTRFTLAEDEELATTPVSSFDREDALANWSFYAEPGARQFSFDIARPGFAGDGTLQLQFDLERGVSAGLVLNTRLAAENWVGSNGLAFVWQSDTAGLPVTIDLLLAGTEGADGEALRYQAELDTPGQEWQLVRLPWVSFVAQNAEGRPRPVSPAQVSSLALNVGGGAAGGGLIWLDELSTYTILLDPDAALVVTDFEEEDFPWWTYNDELLSTFECVQDIYSDAVLGAMRITFDIAAESFSGCGRSFGEPQNWRAGDGLAIRWRSDEPGLPLLFSIYVADDTRTDDSDVTRFLVELETPPDGWTTLVLPWDRFEKPSWDAGQGRETIDQESIVRLTLDFGRPDEDLSGEIWIDEMRLFQGSVEEAAPGDEEEASGAADDDEAAAEADEDSGEADTAGD